jgi:hypothetical protein
MSRVTYENTPSTLDQQALRETHHVRLVSPEEEGTGVNALPAGVYGFTYSPALPNAPLFAERRFRSYETHKLASGEVYVIGFADVDTAAAIESASSERTIQLQPAPDGDANILVKVPYSRIGHHRQYAAPNQHGFTVTITGSEGLRN